MNTSDRHSDFLNKTQLYRARVAVFIIFFVNGAGFATWIPHIPHVQQKFVLSEATLGLTLLAIAVGAIVTMPLAGGLVEKWGSKQVTTLTALAFCAVLPSLMWIDCFPLFVLNLFLLGAFGGSMDVAMNAHGVYLEQQYNKPIMSAFHGLFSTGGLVGAGIAAGLLAAGWTPAQHMGVVAVALFILVIIAVRYLLPPPTRTLPDESEDTPPLFAFPTKGPVIVLAALAFFVFMSEGAMADWTAVYLDNLPEVDAALAAVGFAAFSLTMAAGRLAGDAVVSALGRVQVVRWGSALAAAGIALASFSTHPYWAIAGFALVGLGLSNVIPIIFSAASYLSPKEPGRNIASVTTAGYFGFLVGPPLIGFLAEGISLTGTFQVLAASLLLVAAAAKLVQWRK